MSLDIFQQILLLSFSSNAVSSVKGTQEFLQKQLQAAVVDALPMVGPEWQLAWGPVVWKHEPENSESGPDNSWYVAYHPNLQFEDGSFHSTYVIAIAGTPDSMYVWIEQNFKVYAVSDFNAWVENGVENPPVEAKTVTPGLPYIAAGTVNAVHTLLTTPVPEGGVCAGSTLLSFISDLNKSTSTRVISTGFSLGGALSPALALSLVASQSIPSKITLTYPAAGPSPGDTAFKQLFVNTFPALKEEGALSYQGWNLNLVNRFDIVPQAWCIQKEVSEDQNIFNIPFQYGPEVLPDVRDITNLVALLPLSSRVVYEPLPSQYFSPDAPDQPGGIGEFIQTALWQHTLAYFAEVGVDMPVSDPSEPLRSGLKRKTESEKRLNYPVVSLFEWGRRRTEETRKTIERAEAK